jgi:pSer/pThr/pTyr-binding forkhead associated (FHA) protein
MGAPQIKSSFKFKMKIQRGPLAGQSLSFDKSVVKIGRGTENDVVLANDLRASRQHAEIRWDGHELQIVNLSSKNHTSVNGLDIETSHLDSGAIVNLGETEFRVEYDYHDLEAKTKVVSEPGEPVIVQMPVLQQNRPTPLQPSAMPAIGSIPHYNTNIPGAMGPRPKRPKNPRAQGGDSGGKLRFYAIVAVVGLVFVWLMNSKNVKPKELTFRSTEQIERDIEVSREELKEFEARKEKLDNVQYKKAQENYIRGFRDYKQGNYGRARESFQVVLNLDPDNELAKRYYQLARLKFDELVKFHMLQGNRYREKKNWRMCKASYFNVMTMVNNNQDPVFKEAKQYYDQCSLAQEGRY